MSTPAGERRDEGLSRIGRITRTTLVGGLVAAGALAAVAARTLPGHGASTAGRGSSVGVQRPGGGVQDPGRSNGGGLRPPDGAPGPGTGFDPGFGGGGGAQVGSGGS